MSTRRSAVCAVTLTSLLVGLTAGCARTDDGHAKGRIAVESSAKACDLSTTSARAGNIAFKVNNTGDEVTEFYVYAADGKQVIGEIENIGPGLSRDLVIQAEPGEYITSCRPGMSGQGIRGDFKVTGSARGTEIKGLDQAQVTAATDAYTAYVRKQGDELMARATEFIAAYVAGKDTLARSLYATARAPWERIEPVAESFGDLDPLTDAREADLEPGTKWTGWHRIEKDLWPPAGYTALSRTERKTHADDLMRNLNELHTRLQRMTFTITQIANGSKGLLDEVATGKITGEEDIWSHTDLYDFEANVQGAEEAYQILRPLVDAKDKVLSDRINSAFERVHALLDKHRQGKGFVSYDTVTETQRKELSDAVNALAEPLSQMTGAITL